MIFIDHERLSLSFVGAVCNAREYQLLNRYKQITVTLIIL